ncbi:DUF5590 domain-containing protein [Jeotgalibacillus sp. R-1-5s-1]|uniref:cell wall elongation regulator TseB-like domain-containing protein n=1 Tax=Jeotgalibacillus sp. R-1-5s-1 TaxID=2555897 RepID=UPI00106A5F3D|nr:DUF5590 domain-containing protein [Jeotgalibacillus sp. R-1-5s-1]TFE03236.1 hypothetical protein E2491_00155 [Jeotgalibacillus sp. R-1-5s-1]
MKKWMIILGSCLTVILASLVIVFFVARQPLSDQLNRAEEIASSEFGVTVEESYHFNGSEVYSIVKGTDPEGEQLLVFIPENDELEIETRQLNEGIEEDEVLSMLNAEDEPAKILSSKIGFESVGPVWEIVYKDQEDTLNYYYVKFDDGEWWRTIRNL